MVKHRAKGSVPAGWSDQPRFEITGVAVASAVAHALREIASHALVRAPLLSGGREAAAPRAPLRGNNAPRKPHNEHAVDDVCKLNAQTSSTRHYAGK
jgi:hypothetical protein